MSGSSKMIQIVWRERLFLASICHTFSIFNCLLGYKVQLHVIFFKAQVYSHILILFRQHFDITFKPNSLYNMPDIKDHSPSKRDKETSWSKFYSVSSLLECIMNSSFLFMILSLLSATDLVWIAPVHFKWLYITVLSFCLLTLWTWQASLELTQVPSVTSERCQLVGLKMTEKCSILLKALLLLCRSHSEINKSLLI